MKKISLCCGKPRACPEIWIDFDTVVIKDDDEHMVYMTTDQFKILKDKITKGEFDAVCD